MAFVQFSQVSLAFGDKNILKNVSVNLKTGTKAALTGANGSGKSTLIKIMAGLIEPDSGVRTAQKGCRIAYLPQSGLTHHGCTLLEEADKAFDFGYELQKEIDKLGEQLLENSSNTNALLEQQASLIATLDESGWHRRKAQAESVLTGLGFLKEDFSKQTEEFSGGWQMRIALAKALMQQPDILLLDEPTNYLDIEARNWLEQFLNNFKGAFLLVSHDRYFLDITVNEVLELFGGTLKRYSGNFTHYEKVREVELKTLIAEYEQQQQEIRHLQDFIRRFGAKASKAAQAQERQKQLDKIIPIEIPESLKKIHFTFPQAPHAGRIILRMSDISKSYDGKHRILSDFNLLLENGDRLVVSGKNGAGKTTLLKIIAGEDLNFSGNIELGAGVKVGYFSQDNAESIKGSQSVIDFIESQTPLELIPKIRDMLGSFLFRGDDVFKSLEVLSGGEKSRLALLKLLLNPYNFLILDEPTNHLDIHSKDVLLKALKDFGGTIIFVSHDRGFIEELATKVLELTPGRFREFPGGYNYYMERIEAENAENGTNFSNSKVYVEDKTSSKTSRQLLWEESKKLQAEKRKIEKEVQKIEQDIENLESEKTSLSEQIALPEVYSNGEKVKQIQSEISFIDCRLSDLSIKWEETMKKLEQIG